MASRQQIRELAKGLLEAAAITEPPVPIEELIQSQGIQIARKNMDDDTSGFIYVDSKTNAAVIGLNVRHSRTRQRFTLAHELGHYLMHKNSARELHIDEKDFFVRFRDKDSTDGSHRQEVESNTFAAELLMPTAFLQRDMKLLLTDGVSFSDEKAIRLFAERYGVSLQALVFRLQNMGVFEGSFLK